MTSYRERRRGRRLFPPAGDNGQDQHEAADQRKRRNPPRHASKSAVRRFSEDSLPILLNERLHDEVVGISLRDALVDFLEHAESGFARSGKCAANMITAASGIVATAAHTSHFHSQLVSVIGLLGIANRGKNGRRAGKTE